MYPDDVLPAFVAETDFALAEPIRDALLDAVRIGDTGYASAGGLAEAFVVFAKEWFDWSPDPRRVVRFFRSLYDVSAAPLSHVAAYDRGWLFI